MPLLNNAQRHRAGNHAHAKAPIATVAMTQPPNHAWIKALLCHSNWRIRIGIHTNYGARAGMANGTNPALKCAFGRRNTFMSDCF
eukprot:11157427-Lingulodinium_polyedra.AAC.1